MPKKYRDANRSIHQSFLLPPSLHDWLPEGHLAYFILDVVSQLDLSAIEKVIQSKDPRGERPYSPKMMVALLFYAYANGVFASRRIARRCVEDVGFRVVSNNQQPHFTTIADFRRRYLDELTGLFVQVLQMCVAAGLVKGTHLYVDGTKIQANASKHKAMSYDRMLKTEEKLQAEIDELLRKAAEADAEDDARLGPDGDDSDDVVDEVKRRETRRDWIRQTREALEAEAKKARAKKLRGQAKEQREKAKLDEDESSERKRRETRAKKADAKADALDPEPEPEPEDAADRLPKHQVQTEVDGTPKPKTQRNFTDPDSRIMKDGRGAFIQGYNSQAVVDGENQIIIANGLSNQSPDQQYLPAMLERTVQNLGVSETFTGDAGYYSADNALACRGAGCTPYLALNRERRTWPPPEPEKGAPPEDADEKTRMEWALKTEEGMERMRRRKFKVEPVFGIIKEAMGFRRYLLRGLQKVQGEWSLVCMAFNIRKLHTATA